MQTLADTYTRVRRRSATLAEGLSEADCQVQSMPDASPLKWHLAHTSWFFETFVLERHADGFAPFDPAFRVLFNSYYEGVGARHPRPERGLVTRPGLAQVLAYRRSVDERLLPLLAHGPHAEVEALVTLGLHHEQQHQELMLTDLLHLFSCNPLAPVYRARPERADPLAAATLRWQRHDGGLVEAGHRGNGFAFDNESPRHRVWLEPYELASRCVNRGEWAAFQRDGGYTEARWWSAAGWDWARARGITGPLHDRDGASFTLHGLLQLPQEAPVTHVSWFEADAFARWWSEQHPAAAPARLPTEVEWEHAAEVAGGAAFAEGQFAESGLLHAAPTPAMAGSVWQWTASPYTPYPGFRPWAGAVGEYNAKFMVNQMVLRGGSFATPREHLRTSYRNFFPAEARWQFSGLRLARGGAG